MPDLARINANLLVALDLLLTEGSVTRAAERQGVTASAMSHSLRALRGTFGDPLLTRGGSGMVPTPFAERLRGPLRAALFELQRVVSSGVGFSPSTAKRGFVVRGPDFITTLLAGEVARVLPREAPGVDIEFRPVMRRGQGLLLADLMELENGSIDAVLAAELADTSGIHTAELYAERFVCVVRRGHPALRRRKKLDLETFARLPHVLITITDERTPTWIDSALESHGLSRHIALRTRYFMGAPLVVAESDLLLTCPAQLARYFAKRLPLEVFEPPLELPRYNEYLAWHSRFDADPASRWLRSLLQRAASRALTAEPL
jgi:DNA-binding transcriptional LysR family regulator